MGQAIGVILPDPSMLFAFENRIIYTSLYRVQDDPVRYGYHVFRNHGISA